MLGTIFIIKDSIILPKLNGTLKQKTEELAILTILPTTLGIAGTKVYTIMIVRFKINCSIIEI
jgi:hypothetical protein